MTSVHLTESITKKVKEDFTLRSLTFRNSHLKYCLFSGYAKCVKYRFLENGMITSRTIKK